MASAPHSSRASARRSPSLQFNLVQDATWFRGVDAQANVASSLHLVKRSDGSVLPLVVMTASKDMRKKGAPQFW